MRIAIIAGLAMLALAGCQTARHPSCLGHTAADVAPSAAAYAGMSGSERRAAEARLNQQAELCGWEP
jgi:hypothetical protein